MTAETPTSRPEQIIRQEWMEISVGNYPSVTGESFEEIAERFEENLAIISPKDDDFITYATHVMKNGGDIAWDLYPHNLKNGSSNTTLNYRSAVLADPSISAVILKRLSQHSLVIDKHPPESVLSALEYMRIITEKPAIFYVLMRIGESVVSQSGLKLAIIHEKAVDPAYNKSSDTYEQRSTALVKPNTLGGLVNPEYIDPTSGQIFLRQVLLGEIAAQIEKFHAAKSGLLAKAVEKPLLVHRQDIAIDPNFGNSKPKINQPGMTSTNNPKDDGSVTEALPAGHSRKTLVLDPETGLAPVFVDRLGYYDNISRLHSPSWAGTARRQLGPRKGKPDQTSNGPIARIIPEGSRARRIGSNTPNAETKETDRDQLAQVIDRLKALPLGDIRTSYISDETRLTFGAKIRETLRPKAYDYRRNLKEYKPISETKRDKLIERGIGTQKVLNSALMMSCSGSKVKVSTLSTMTEGYESRGCIYKVELYSISQVLALSKYDRNTARILLTKTNSAQSSVMIRIYTSADNPARSVIITTNEVNLNLRPRNMLSRAIYNHPPTLLRYLKTRQFIKGK